MKCKVNISSITESVNVLIKLTDENDNPPIIQKYKNNSVIDIQNTFKDSFLDIKFEATDLDSGENGKCQFKYDPNNKTELFFVNEAGELRRKSDLNLDGRNETYSFLLWVSTVSATYLVILVYCIRGNTQNT